MQRVTLEDLPDVRRFLRGHMAQAMFPLNNLDRFGLDGAHEYAPRMWMARPAGEITGVLSQCRNGAVMPCLPEGEVEAAAQVLRTRDITGFIGPAAACRALIAALGLTGRAAILDRDEPQYLLNLAKLQVPEGAGALHPLTAAAPAEMIAWRSSYEQEALGAGPEAAAAKGAAAYDAYCAAGSHRVLMDNQDRALCTTGFNAALPEMVQVGGVYTPPALRGRGHAGRAVALHLAEARARGVGAATLFAATPQAARVYERIGFEWIGAWTLCLYRQGERAAG